MIGANVLSHYLDSFALVTAWLLFFVGLVCLLFGLAFAARVKAWRSFSREQRARAWTRRNSQDGVRGPGGWPPLRTEKHGTPELSGSRHQPDDLEKQRSGAHPVRTLAEAFAYGQESTSQRATSREPHKTANILSPSYDDVLRARAREANERFEREQEARLGRELRGERHHLDESPFYEAEETVLSGGFVYDSRRESNVAIGAPRSRCTTDVSDNIAVKSFGVNGSTTRPCQNSLRSSRESRMPVSIYQHPGATVDATSSDHQESLAHDRYGKLSKHHARLPASVASTRRAAAATSKVQPERAPLSLHLRRRSLAMAQAARRRLSGSSRGTSKNSNAKRETTQRLPRCRHYISDG